MRSRGRAEAPEDADHHAARASDSIKTTDLNGYRTVNRKPTSVGYRRYDMFGMAPSSSGGSTVGEALDIMERYDLGAMTDANALHHYLEASALAFADRGAYVGDPTRWTSRVRGSTTRSRPSRHARSARPPRPTSQSPQATHGVQQQLRDARPGRLT